MDRVMMFTRIDKLVKDVQALHEFYKIYGGPERVTIEAEDFDAFALIDTSNPNFGWLGGFKVRRRIESEENRFKLGSCNPC